MDWLKVIMGKYIGGALVIGAGLSLGREGPSVQLGAAVGQAFSKVLLFIILQASSLKIS